MITMILLLHKFGIHGLDLYIVNSSSLALEGISLNHLETNAYDYMIKENVIVAGADNRPPMLDKTNYSSWASRMLMYIKGKPNGKLLVDYVLNGPFQYRTIVEPGTKTTPATVRARTYTDLIDEEKLRESVDITTTNIVLQGSELSLQEQEAKLYDDFDTFTSMPEETIHSYYMQFSQLINDMHTIGMTLKPLQVNTKFVDHLQPEWSKFVTDVKLAKTCIPPTLITGLVVPTFNPSDDPIASLNKAMAFLSTTFASRFPQTNNQLRTSSNPMNQATIQDGRVTVQIVQGTQTQGYANNRARNTTTYLGVNRQGTVVQPRAVKCYNCQEEGHFAQQCTKPKRPKNSSWFKEKMQLSWAIFLPMTQTFFQRNAKVADFEKQIHSLKLQLNATVESHKTLSTTVECLKKESKQKEDKYLDEVIDLQKKNKALDNVHFVPQTKLSAEQAYWLPISQPVVAKPPVPSEPVLKKEIPRELPSIRLVKDSFHKMREHVNKFDETITFRTKITANRIGSWGVDHIKWDFEKDVKSFAQTLKGYFRMFERGLHKELKEMKAVFTLMKTEELLVYVSATCPSTKHVSDKLVAVTPMNRTRKVSCSAEARGSNPRSNTKNDRIPQTSCRNKKKNKVEDQPRIAKSSLNNVNRISKIVCSENIKHFVLNANYELVCATCHECMFDAIDD
ncbi:retrovirus-related pol polyprotein from transposon TNT 1-94 [Tanacetum coccineum]|uniref:Retrovirus-related pol polyprotein from transposon TNT 1-94 n=1 Tax=Tanacetum coccineum TaxID=301880 RepID=A0ABQ5ENX4_9ASTR